MEEEDAQQLCARAIPSVLYMFILNSITTTTTTTTQRETVALAGIVLTICERHGCANIIILAVSRLSLRY